MTPYANISPLVTESVPEVRVSSDIGYNELRYDPKCPSVKRPLMTGYRTTKWVTRVAMAWKSPRPTASERRNGGRAERVKLRAIAVVSLIAGVGEPQSGSFVVIDPHFRFHFVVSLFKDIEEHRACAFFTRVSYFFWGVGARSLKVIDTAYGLIIAHVQWSWYFFFFLNNI